MRGGKKTRYYSAVCIVRAQNNSQYSALVIVRINIQH